MFIYSDTFQHSRRLQWYELRQLNYDNELQFNCVECSGTPFHESE